jgi:hypothetical protein
MSSTGCRLRSQSMREVRKLVARILHAFILLFFSGAVGCGFPEPPKVITISKAPAFRPRNPNDVHSIEQATLAVITICRDDLGLPLVDPLTVNLHPDTYSFGFFSRGWATLPYDVSGQRGSAGGNKIHINLEQTGLDLRGGLLWTLAHEYGHTITASVAGHSYGSWWFDEGFAEWVAARTLHSLGRQDYSISLHKAERETKINPDLERSLVMLSGKESWGRLGQMSRGRARTYSLALLAVDRLIQRTGIRSALLYLKTKKFAESFEMSQERFISEFGAHVRLVSSSTRSSFRFLKPNWKIGDEWSYVEKRNSENTTIRYRRAMVREDTFVGVPSYVITDGHSEILYAKESFGLMAKKNVGGRFHYRKSNLDVLVSWPLIPEKEWRSTFTRESADSIRSSDHFMVSSGVEEIRVPAGSMKTIKIDVYEFTKGRMVAEYWYWPEAKWFAKSRVYDRDEGLIEEELVSFRLN